MPNAVIPNASLISGSSDFISSWWRLTRGLKAAGWRYKASSDGTTKETTGNPSLDKWGGGVQVGAQTATVSFTIATPSTTAKGGRSVITGLTGFVLASEGRFLAITGATNAANVGTWLITKFISATSVEIENPAAIAETTPGTATWTEKSSITDTMPAAFQGTAGSGAWWCGEGPSTMKIPIGSGVPTGTFLRGENVVQTTSGATGEILGVMTDVAGGVGHLVIAPRKSGTGAAVRGWSSSATITGSTSGATIVPTGTPIEYVRELVIWKGSSTATHGHMYFQCVDSVNESTPGATVGRFSQMATLAGCTATVAPGGAASSSVPSVNGFPTVGTYVICGQGAPATLATNQTRLFSGNSNTDSYGVCNAMCANCIEDVGVSQDGSYVLSISTAAGLAYIGSAFQRCDDGEEGDVDPYVHWQQGAANYDSAPTTTGRTIRNVELGSTNSTFFHGAIAVNAFTPFFGSRRRGFATGDAYQAFQGFLLMNLTSMVIGQTPGTVDRVATAPVLTAVREPIWIVSTQYAQRIRKGTLRWMYWVQGGSAADTYDTKSWVQMATTVSATVAGPWDGTTVPTI